MSDHRPSGMATEGRAQGCWDRVRGRTWRIRGFEALGGRFRRLVTVVLAMVLAAWGRWRTGDDPLMGGPEAPIHGREPNAFQELLKKCSRTSTLTGKP